MGETATPIAVRNPHERTPRRHDRARSGAGFGRSRAGIRRCDAGIRRRSRGVRGDSSDRSSPARANTLWAWRFLSSCSPIRGASSIRKRGLCARPYDCIACDDNSYNRLGRLTAYPWLEQVLIAGFGHPAGARQVALMDDFGAAGLLRWIDPKEHQHDLSPVGALFLGHQQPKVYRQMLLIIGVHAVGKRRPVIEKRPRSLRSFPRRDQSNGVGIYLPQILTDFAPD